MKVKIGSLPDGWKVINGKVVKTMAHGGTVNKTLGPIDRESANLEAEKGETALTDLTNDGSFELYNIGGKRHTEGGTPLNLPEQSFVYSDTRSMKLTVEELMSLGIKSNKKMTPAEASKRFPLNEFIETLESENSDKVSIDTAEEMIDKNKIKLSQIAFIQESKKDFSDGLPLAAYPFLVSKGINPQEMEAKIAEKNAPQQNPSPQMSQDQMAMGPQQGLQEFTGPPQGAMPPMGKYGTEVPEYQEKGETRKQRRNRIKNYEHPYLEEYNTAFANSGMSDENDVKNILSSMNVTPSDTLFTAPGYNSTNAASTLGFDVRNYMMNQEGTNSYSAEDNKFMKYHTTPPDEEGDSWDFMKQFYNNDNNQTTGVLKSKKEYGGSHTMPDGTVHAGATHEDYLAMMGQPKIGSYGYGAEYKKGGSLMCPKCGKLKSKCGCNYAMGGQPFEENPLKRFTDGGMQQVAMDQGKPSDEQIALQNILAYRQKLVLEYENTASYIKENPNALEDPEKAYELQASIQVMEQQLEEIDIQTQAIQSRMMQERVQIDPFAQESAQQAPPMENYKGGGQPGFWANVHAKRARGESPDKSKVSDKTAKRFNLQDGAELSGSDAWGYQGQDEEGNPIIGHSEPAFDTYDAEVVSGQEAHGAAFNVMASSEFDPPRKLWLAKYRESAEKNQTGKNNWITGKSDAELFMIFNRMNQYLSSASADGHKFAANGEADDATAKKYGWGDKAPTKEEVKIFQGMYESLNTAKITDESGLLNQIVTTPMGEHHKYTSADIKKLKKNNKWTDQKAGDNKMIDANGNPVSFVDGALGHTTGGQFYRADNQQNSSTVTKEKNIPCPADVREKRMKECLEQGKRFDQATCGCAPVTGDWTTPKYPEYETFPQDDLLVATKSAQLAGLEQINPIMEPTFDPQLVNPHYVDPRQGLASIEASGAAAMRANPDQASVIMGAMQDQSEKVINQHEALNTKIYNNAQNVNVPLINKSAEESADNFKTYFDETNAAKENFNVGKMTLSDNLVNAVNDQMSNADRMFIENAENPNYWYSPQAHNIEYYNARDLDGKTRSNNPLDQEMADYEYLQANNPDFAKIYYDKMYGKKNAPTKGEKLDTERESEKVVAKHGQETKRMKKRQEELSRSKKELRKWILGYK